MRRVLAARTNRRRLEESVDDVLYVVTTDVPREPYESAEEWYSKYGYHCSECNLTPEDVPFQDALRGRVDCPACVDVFRDLAETARDVEEAIQDMLDAAKLRDEYGLLRAFEHAVWLERRAAQVSPNTERTANLFLVPPPGYSLLDAVRDARSGDIAVEFVRSRREIPY